MNPFKALAKIALSPIKAVTEIVDDLKGENSEDAKFFSIATMGVSSIVKGTAKAVKEAADEVFEK